MLYLNSDWMYCCSKTLPHKSSFLKNCLLLLLLLFYATFLVCFSLLSDMLTEGNSGRHRVYSFFWNKDNTWRSSHPKIFSKQFLRTGRVFSKDRHLMHCTWGTIDHYPHFSSLLYICRLLWLLISMFLVD